MAITDVVLRQTCYACPEQYDAYDENGNEIAYLRLRHGYFRVECPFGGELVYSASPEGDGLFMSHEREFYLERAKSAIMDYYNNKQNYGEKR